MYRRADLSRTITLVVALFLTAASTSVFAREFRAAATQNEDYPTAQALRYMGSMVAERSGGGHRPSFVTTDHYKFAGYYPLTEHTMNPEVLAMSQKAWSSLSPEDQKIFCEAALRSRRFMREKWRDLEERSRKQTEDAGVKIVTDIDRKPFEAAMAGIYARTQRDPAMAQLIERIRKVE